MSIKMSRKPKNCVIYSMDPSQKWKKEFLYPFLSKTYKLLENNSEVFIWDRLKTDLGKCDWENIFVDPFNPDSNLASVTIHEALHWFYPKWTENKVLATEKKVMKNLSRTQLKNLYRRIFNSMS